MPDDMDGADNERNPANTANNSPVAPDAQINASSSPEAVDAGATAAAPADAATEPSAEAVAEASDPDARYPDFWDVLKSCTAPIVRARKWDFLGERDGYLRIDMPPIEFAAAMAQECSAELLIAIGLYERVDGELRPVHCLHGDAPLYVKFDEVNCDLSYSRPCEFLFPMIRTALDSAFERIPPESTQATTTLYIVNSQDAAEVVQQLGLQSVSCDGLEALGRDEVEKLFDGDPRSDCGWRYYLLIVDFDVAGLQHRQLAAMEEVINRLADAEEVYGIDPSRRFGVCRPTAEEFHRLERAISFNDATQVRQMLERWSAAAKGVSVNSWRTHFDPAKLSFSAATAALTHALQHPNEVVRRAEVIVALPAYRVAGRGAVMQKFYDAIERAHDPFDQVDLIAAAGYAETFLDSDPLVRAGEAVLAGQNPPSSRDLQAELDEQRQRSMAELRRIRRDRRAKR